MKPPLVLTTSRLQLRPPVMSDAEKIFTSYAQDAEVTKYLVWRSHQTIKTTSKFLQQCITAWETEQEYPWVILCQQDNQLIGMIRLRIQGYHADFGYVLARHCWGMGFATEVVRTLVEWVLAQPNIYRVWAVCDIDNRASARVLEKSGLTCEGVLRRWSIHPNISEEPRDCACYAKIK